MSSAKTLLKFEALLKKLNGVYRDLGSIHKAGELDNDAEHSYRVAMLCWMLVDEYKLKLDRNKVIRYALVHDLPEAYAGDVSIHASQKERERAKKKEEQAARKMAMQFPRQKSIWSDLQSYEKRRDAESKFVYMVEKLEPILVVLLSEPDAWIKRKVTFDQLIERKQKKIKDLDTVAQRFNQDLMEYLKRRKKAYFEK